MRAKFILLLLLTCFIVQQAIAQQEGGANRSLRFIAFPQKPGDNPIELSIGDGRTMAIETPGHELSRPYQVEGLNSIVVGVTKFNAENKPVFHVLGKAPALSSKRQIVLLFPKGEDEMDGFAVLPVDGDLTKFSGGNYMFINVSKLNVAGKIGDKAFAVKPGKRRLIKPKATHTGGGCQVTLAYQKGEKWKAVYDTRWTVNPRYRSLIFFYQDPESGKLGVVPIIEIL